MKMYNKYDYFVFSSNCKITKGHNRSLIVDYPRNQLYFVANKYYDLLQKLNRHNISAIESIIDGVSSKKSFNEFISFLLENEIGFLTKTLDNFPEIDNNVYESNVILKDIILEIDLPTFNSTLKDKVYSEINTIGCNDIQIKCISKYSKHNISTLMNEFEKLHINYVELHLNGSEILDIDFYNSLLETNAKLSHIYIYGKSSNKIIPHYLKTQKYVPLHMGNIYYINQNLETTSYCGIINKGNLTFDDITAHNDLLQTNGCLNKKLVIDKKGYIRNCLYLNNNFGKITEKSIIEVLKTSNFKDYWLIKKDNIEICKDCEFRYSCTDCRAFISDKNNILSKPSKCKYDPYTNLWES